MDLKEYVKKEREAAEHRWRGINLNTGFGTGKTVPHDWIFEEMLISAERYACGRSSGIVQDTVCYITNLLYELSDRTLTIMCNDFETKQAESEAAGRSFWGMEQDEEQWKRLWKLIAAEREERKDRRDENGQD